MPTDNELLRDYARDRSESAFTELVRRHVDMVYSAALRETRGDAPLAEDITQAVFSEVARKASQLCPHPAFAGWLYTCVRQMTANARRAEERRLRRELEAHTMNEVLSHNSLESDWRQLQPVLDDAMYELDEPDRAAVVLRFFEDQSHKEVGLALGFTESAARKRVDRALERLRTALAKRGITTAASGLAVVISTNAVQAAPVGLALSISTAAALTGTTFATTTTITATKALAMTALQKTIVTGTIAVLAGACIYEVRQAAQLREQVQTLQQQETPLTEQIQQLQRERDDATSRLNSLNATANGRENDNTELLKLRGEVTRLRIVARELAQAKDRSQITTNVLGATADAWAKRANSFKQWFEQNPDKSIPELQLLKDDDWLYVARLNPQVFTNRSEGNDIHMIADGLRDIAKRRFAALLTHALGNYIAANAGSLPDDLPQLLPYFAPAGDASPFARSVDPSILQRYELLHTGKISDVLRGEPIIKEKAPVDDVVDSVMSVMVGSYSFQSTGKVADMMRQGEPISWSNQDIEKIRPFLR
jgi:RNA polymerase sigma factor (sigma-70 family)